MPRLDAWYSSHRFDFVVTLTAVVGLLLQLLHSSFYYMVILRPFRLFRYVGNYFFFYCMMIVRPFGIFRYLGAFSTALCCLGFRTLQICRGPFLLHGMVIGLLRYVGDFFCYIQGSHGDWKTCQMKMVMEHAKLAKSDGMLEFYYFYPRIVQNIYSFGHH